MWLWEIRKENETAFNFCHRQDKKPHPFHVKSTWKLPLQLSVALESYLEEVRTQLAEVKLTKQNITYRQKNERRLKP